MGAGPSGRPRRGGTGCLMVVFQHDRNIRNRAPEGKEILRSSEWRLPDVPCVIEARVLVTMAAPVGAVRLAGVLRGVLSCPWPIL